LAPTVLVSPFNIVSACCGEEELRVVVLGMAIQVKALFRGGKPISFFIIRLKISRNMLSLFFCNDISSKNHVANIVDIVSESRRLGRAGAANTEL